MPSTKIPLMKKIFSLILLFQTAFLFAGPPAISHDWISYHSSINLSATQYNNDFSLLNKQLELWGAKKTFAANYYTFGIGFITGEESAKRKGKWDGASSIEWMPSTTIGIGSNDSVSYRMKGWHMMTSSFGKDLIPGKVVALVIAPGIDWGTTKLFRKTGGNETKYKNPFVSPLLRADLRFVFGKLSIGGRALYRFDISNNLWKRKADLMPVLPGTKFTGLGLNAFIGIDLGGE